MARNVLLVCGILGALLYLAMTLFIGLLWDGYSVASQTPSELAAIGAPTRPLWILRGTVYAALMVAFGWMVRKSAPQNRALRVVGALLMTQAVFGYFWPPMHQRAALAAGGGTLTDTLHLVWAMVTVLLFMLAMAFGAAALGKRFRTYTIATIAVTFACGAWTATYASRIQADLPTPWVGVLERLSIAGFMLWIAVLAATLLRAGNDCAGIQQLDSQRSRGLMIMDTFKESDPAEQSSFNRLFYRNRRPTWFGHWVSQFFCWWARFGLPPQSRFELEVRDRVSGRVCSDAIVIPTVSGQRYIVSMFGTISDWVQNVEAANGDAVIRHGGALRVRLVLVPPEERAPILREYVRVASSGRKHFPLPVGASLADFAAIAAQYPVYRVEDAPAD